MLPENKVLAFKADADLQVTAVATSLAGRTITVQFDYNDALDRDGTSAELMETIENACVFPTKEDEEEPIGALLARVVRTEVAAGVEVGFAAALDAMGESEEQSEPEED
ncbi:hypothetical protein [Candidatus Palauibacter sp.]|uniref:hypothetical protein n=1 Tax=Candidatus Palauibacter sp. TaxID=3101350 RepID=UPI003B02B6B4